MEDKDTHDLRQQVVESTKLLLKAVDRLECKSKGEGRSSSSALVPTSSTSSSSTSSQTQSASKLEMNKLFNWSSGSNVRKRKKTTSKTTSSGLESKKKKLQQYKHVFSCLSSTTQE